MWRERPSHALTKPQVHLPPHPFKPHPPKPSSWTPTPLPTNGSHQPNSPTSPEPSTNSLIRSRTPGKKSGYLPVLSRALCLPTKASSSKLGYGITSLCFCSVSSRFRRLVPCSSLFLASEWFLSSYSFCNLTGRCSFIQDFEQKLNALRLVEIARHVSRYIEGRSKFLLRLVGS